MNNKPLLQLVTGVYNGGDRFKTFLDCISNQTYENLELIIVNDCSTDLKTIKILDDLKKGKIKFNKKFFIIENEKNLGVEKTFQKGLDYTISDYVAFPESDDYIDYNFYEILMKYITKTNSDVVEGLLLTYYINNNKEPEEQLLEKEYYFDILNLENDYTHSWYYVFKKTLLLHNSVKPMFINAIKYSAYNILYTSYYKEYKVPIEEASFYIFYADGLKKYKNNLYKDQLRMLKEITYDFEHEGLKYVNK